MGRPLSNTMSVLALSVACSYLVNLLTGIPKGADWQFGLAVVAAIIAMCVVFGMLRTQETALLDIDVKEEALQARIVAATQMDLDEQSRIRKKMLLDENAQEEAMQAMISAAVQQERRDTKAKIDMLLEIMTIRREVWKKVVAKVRIRFVVGILMFGLSLGLLYLDWLRRTQH